MCVIFIDIFIAFLTNTRIDNTIFRILLISYVEFLDFGVFIKSMFLREARG